MDSPPYLYFQPLREVLNITKREYHYNEIAPSHERCFICLCSWGDEEHHSDEQRESMCTAIRLSCGHVVGKQCFDMWRDIGDDRERCPLCRQNLEPPCTSLWVSTLRRICNTSWFRFINEDMIESYGPGKYEVTSSLYRFQRGWPLYDIGIFSVIAQHHCFQISILLRILAILLIDPFQRYLSPFVPSLLASVIIYKNGCDQRPITAPLYLQGHEMNGLHHHTLKYKGIWRIASWDSYSIPASAYAIYTWERAHQCINNGCNRTAMRIWAAATIVRTFISIIGVRLAIAILALNISVYAVVVALIVVTHNYTTIRQEILS